jgi:hypothetical protein
MTAHHARGPGSIPGVGSSTRHFTIRQLKEVHRASRPQNKLRGVVDRARKKKT